MKNTFQTVQLDGWEKSSLAYRPGMSNIKAYIKELAKDPTHDHIRGRLEKVIADINIHECSKTTIHCEMQLLDYILKESAKDPAILREMYDFIGCSKRPCYLCAGAINLGTVFKVADSHWKLYWPWGIPKALLKNRDIAHAFSSLRHKMDVILKDEIWRPGRRDTSEQERDAAEESEFDYWDWTPDLVPESPVAIIPPAHRPRSPTPEEIDRLEQLLTRLGLVD
ncbi:hypothetical protein F4819DRAFT_490648 [Hypoxylon fuscum]|nr:hypothetical protein F4819DRAFT_490648 [Hypoxylon fuscum]